MATYIYETVPDSPGESVRRFEVKQSMKDAALTHDPETGKRVRRVISGGLAIMTGRRGLGPDASGAVTRRRSCGGGACGCC
ncbi:MAG: zinc ribbon domain-containing protein [Verrucomicrobia bacterium]|nr:zinc ribbon domain-containing protein [Verrucomicrobiota bacterium]